MTQLGLYIVGGAPEEVSRSHGDYLQWFDRLARRFGATLAAADGRIGERLDVHTVDGVVITGSPASLTEREPWMEGGFELIDQSRRSGTPLLGICFGHQLLGAALGAEVVSNPAGWEFATQPIEVRRADPLFTGLGQRFEVNQAHRDAIDPTSLPNEIEVLAGNEKGIQAIACGGHLRGVQFHPEFNGPITRTYVDVRRVLLAEDAALRSAPSDHPDQLEARDTPAAEQVFGNFIEHFVKPRG